MGAYTAKQCKNATADLTPTTHGTIMQLGRCVEDVGQNHTWIIRELTSPDLFNDLYSRKNCLLWSNGKMSQNFGPSVL
jgi:hypothetical protein